MNQTTVFLVKRNEQFQLLRILPGGKDVVDSNGNEVKLVAEILRDPRWRDTIGWWWDEVVGQTMVIEGDGTAFLVRRNGLFKILLRVPVEGGDAVDNRGRKYRQGTSLMGTGRGEPWWCVDDGQVWKEVVGPPPPIKLATPEPKEISVFLVEEKTYVDQWGFERTEKIATEARKLFLLTSGMAHDSAGNRFVESRLFSGQWCKLSAPFDIWYNVYPGQLMKRTRVCIKAANLTMRLRNRTARGGVVSHRCAFTNYGEQSARAHGMWRI